MIRAVAADEWTEQRPPRCPECGYDLRGLATLKCPECGFQATMGELREESRRARREATELRQANDQVRLGLTIGLTSAVVAALTAFGQLTSITLVVGGLGGLAAAVYGGQGLRALKATEHGRSLAKEPPNYMLAAFVIVLGVVTAVASVWLA